MFWNVKHKIEKFKMKKGKRETQRKKKKNGNEKSCMNVECQLNSLTEREGIVCVIITNYFE